jgi:hypothetical protein
LCLVYFIISTTVTITGHFAPHFVSRREGVYGAFDHYSRKKIVYRFQSHLILTITLPILTVPTLFQRRFQPLLQRKWTYWIWFSCFTLPWRAQNIKKFSNRKVVRQLERVSQKNKNYQKKKKNPFTTATTNTTPSISVDLRKSKNNKITISNTINKRQRDDCGEGPSEKRVAR